MNEDDCTEKTWFEARIQVFAFLGLMTFLSLMLLLVFAALLTCCHLTCIRSGHRASVTENVLAEEKKHIWSCDMLKTEKEREMHRQMTEKGRLALQNMLDPRQSL